MSTTQPLRFLVDAQRPRRLPQFLAFHTGCGCRHTLALRAANRTQDGSITQLQMAERRVAITKDVDFVNSLLLHGQPHKLLLIKNGQLLKDNMRRELITRQALRSEVRSSGLTNIDGIAEAYMEPSGRISIIQKEEKLNPAKDSSGP